MRTRRTSRSCIAPRHSRSMTPSADTRRRASSRPRSSSPEQVAYDRRGCRPRGAARARAVVPGCAAAIARGDFAPPGGDRVSLGRRHSHGSGRRAGYRSAPGHAARAAGPATDISGQTLSGDALKVSLGPGGRDTLLAFMGTGCHACAPLWDAMHSDAVPTPAGARLVVVTKGPSASASRGCWKSLRLRPRS